MALTAAQLMVKIGGDSSEAERSINKVNGLVKGMGGLALKAAGGLAAMFAIRGASDMAKQLTNYSAQLEQSAIAWGTLLKSQAEGERMLERLQQFAKRTPFDFTGVEEGARRLKAMGFEAEEILPWMETLGNTTSALGLGTEGLNRLILALGQMRAKTKVSGEEMRQLTEAGVPAWDILAKAIGKTTSETMQLATAGKISASTFLAAFQEFATAEYGGMMEKQSQTFKGATSNIRDSLLQLGTVAAQPIFEQMSAGARNFAETLGSIKVQQFAQDIAAGLQSALDATKGLGEKLKPVTKGIGDKYREMVAGIVGMFAPLGAEVQKTLEVIKQLWEEHGDEILGALKTLAADLFASFQRMMQTAERVIGFGLALIRGDWESAWQYLRDIVYTVWEQIVTNVTKGVEALARITQKLADMLGREGVVADVEASIQEMNVWRDELLASSRAVLKVSDDLDEGAQSLNRWNDLVAEGEKLLGGTKLGKASTGMGTFRMLEQELATSTNSMTATLGTASLAIDDFSDSVSEAADNLNSKLIPALITANPAMVLIGSRIVGLEGQIAAINGAIAANEQEQRRWQERIKATQERITGLQGEISRLEGRLRELSSPRLVGMGELEMQMQAIEDHLRRIDLARTLRMPLDEIVQRFPLLAEGAEDFIATLPTSRRALERLLEAMQERAVLTFGQQQRLLQEAATPPQAEMTFAGAMAEIASIQEQLPGLQAELTRQQERLESQQRALERVQGAAQGLQDALRGLQGSLQQAQMQQSVMNTALELAYTWFAKDREEMLAMGGAAAEQVPIIDAKARELINTVQLFATGETSTTVETLQGMVTAFKLSTASAVLAVLDNLGKIPREIVTIHRIRTVYEGGAAGPAPEPRQAGGAVSQGRAYIVGEAGPELFIPNISGYIAPRASAGGINVVVNVAGSVTAEKDLAEAIRVQLARVGRRNLNVGLA